MAERKTGKPSPPVAPQKASRARDRVETSHVAKRAVAKKIVSPKRFSHTALGNR
ncbi:MAG: hypothetical protein ACRD2J_06915 [Thermoanaerobaculia bacterium]